MALENSETLLIYRQFKQLCVHASQMVMRFLFFRYDYDLMS